MASLAQSVGERRQMGRLSSCLNDASPTGRKTKAYHTQVYEANVVRFAKQNDVSDDQWKFNLNKRPIKYTHQLSLGTVISFVLNILQPLIPLFGTSFSDCLIVTPTS